MPRQDKQLTGEGLDELCANALQLVTDNKVNMKNCFDVELIEHIGELMQRYETDGEMNFHRAAGTLDASARIYAYRVDQVHQDAFKVKGSIMHQEDEGEAGPGGTGKTRAPKGAQTLEQARNITLTDVDQEDKVDGYFKQMARKLENGGSKALLLNILPYGPNGVVFDGLQPCAEVNTDAKTVGDDKAPLEIPHLAGRVAPKLAQLLPSELFLDSVNLSADDDSAEDDSEKALSPAPEPPMSPAMSHPDGDLPMTLDPEPAADDPDGEADFAAGDGLEDEHGVAGYQDEVDFLVENVCVDSDFAFFDDIWQTRRKAKKEAEKKAEKEKAEKKEKVCFDMLAAFGNQMDEDIKIDIESVDKHTTKRKRAKKPELWDSLSASTWAANPDAFFRLDWLDRLLPPKSKTGNVDLNNPGAALPDALPEDDGAFCDDVAFADVLDDPMCAENELPPEDITDLCVAEAPHAPSVPGNVNVARVKQGMRTALEAMLAPSDEPCKKKSKKMDPTAGNADATPQTTFTELMETVRTGMPEGEKSSLTVAIAFICTLHMCNEHNLELERSDADAFGDFRITKMASTEALEDSAQAPALCA
jgi:hypothetical protein